MSLTADSGSVTRKLRVLLIAYEFPPNASAQSLRWAYLAGRLAEFGHEVHVMAPAIAGAAEGLPPLGPQVKVHRVWPGPVRSLIGWLERRRPAHAPDGAGTSTSVTAPSSAAVRSLAPPRLNWKGRLLHKCLRTIGWSVFPDVRGEWYLPGRLALSRLLREVRPDVVVSSHEPATTLQLGLHAKRKGFRWVVDMADPVLAPYTPLRWRRHARDLEARVMRDADQVLMTTQSAIELLRERHGDTGAPMSVATQGFDEELSADRLPKRRDGDLKLLYAGSFYSFRDPRVLIEAILDVPNTSLWIASGNVPDWVIACAKEFPRKLILLGAVPHRHLLRLQRQTDILVNLANADPCQVPGKLYEYFGAGRPILHLSVAESDSSGDLLRVLKRGWARRGDRAEVVRVLSELVDMHREGRLEAGLDLTLERVRGWTWTATARQVESVLLQTVNAGS